MDLLQKLQPLPLGICASSVGSDIVIRENMVTHEQNIMLYMCVSSVDGMTGEYAVTPEQNMTLSDIHMSSEDSGQIRRNVVASEQNIPQDILASLHVLNLKEDVVHMGKYLLLEPETENKPQDWGLQWEECVDTYLRCQD